MSSKFKVVVFLLIIAGIFSGYIYFKFYFKPGKENETRYAIDSITGQNLTVTVFSIDGKVLRKWNNVKIITTIKDKGNFSYFYTKDKKYVQIPESVTYIAEEE